jgi:transposase
LKAGAGSARVASGPDPLPIKIPRPVRRELESLVRRQRAPHVVVQRARLVLAAHRGESTEQIARRYGCSARTVRKWKARFAAAPSLVTLEDGARSGRPARISLATRCQLVQLACARPEGCKSPAPFRDVWTYRSLAEAVARRTGQTISTSEVGRILRFEDLRPHRVRQWLKSEDPEFLSKAEAVCRLYLHPPKDAVVVCVDEKPLQVLERKHATRVDPRDASVRFEYEYIRHGTQALLAAFDVRTGRVLGRVVPHRSADALVRFMDELARRYPAKTVYVVWDNLNIHKDGADERWSRFNERHGRRFRFVYTPKHASWMNQVEIWFSILQRRIIKHGDFATKTVQAQRVLGFIDHWNRVEGHPFRWTWRTDRLQNRGDAAARHSTRAARRRTPSRHAGNHPATPPRRQASANSEARRRPHR